MLSHCRPPPTVGEFFAGRPHWHTQRRDRDSDQPSIRGGKKNGWQKFFVVGAGSARSVLRTASGSTLGGARTQVRARTTRERMYESLGLCHCFLFSGLVEYYFLREGSKYTHTHNTHTQHTHTHTHTLTGVCGIGSIICRFLE